MAIDKTRQTLQHLRTSEVGKKVVKDQLLAGEIAVRYSHEDPALMIQDVDGHIVEFISSGAVHTAIQALDGGVQQELETLKENLSGFSAYTNDRLVELEDNVWVQLSAITDNSEAISALSGSAFARDEALNTYATTLSGSAFARDEAEAQLRSTADEALQARATDLEKAVSGLSTNYATLEYVNKASGDIETTINALSGSAYNRDEALNTRITTLSSSTEAVVAAEAQLRSAADEALQGRATDLEKAVSGLADNYATLEYVNKASGDIETTINALSGSAYNRDEALNTRITTLSSSTEAVVAAEAQLRSAADEALQGRATDLEKAVSGLADNYATQEYVKEVSGDIKSTIDALSGSAFARDEALNTYATTLSGSAFARDEALAQAIQTKTEALSGMVITLSGDVVDYIDKKADDIQKELGTVYHVKESVADVNALAAIADAEVGDVHNVIASGTTLADGFIESGKLFAAGSNFVKTENGWDILGGTIDMTALNDLSAATVSGFATEAQARSSADEALQARATDLEKAVSGLSTNYATLEYVNKASGDIETTINALSGSAFARDEALNTYATTLSGSAFARDEAEAQLRSAADEALQGRATDLEKAVSGLSTNYATLEYVNKASGDIETTINALSGSAYNRDEALNTRITTLSSSTEAVVAAEAQLRSAADEALQGRATDLEKAVSGLADNYATQEYVKEVSGDIKSTIDALSGSAFARDEALNTYATTLSGSAFARDEALAQAITGGDEALAASLSAVSAVTVTAVQGASLGEVKSSDANYTKQSDAQMSVVDNQITLDLRYLSIDCGTF